MHLQPVQAIPEDVTQFVVFAVQAGAVSVPDADLDALVQEAITAEMFRGKADEILPLVKGKKVCVLVGVGESIPSVSSRKIGSLTKKALQTKPLSAKAPVAVMPAVDDEFFLRSLINGAKLGLYKWDKYKTTQENEEEEEEFRILIQTRHHDFVQRQSVICDGVNFARDLGNENAQIMTTEHLTEVVLELVSGNPRCSVEVLGRKELEAKGFGLHLAVCQGSEQEPRLVIVTYNGGQEKDPYTALIGKGMTFDSGGLNLKPTGSIETMRMDMCGAAAVIGTLHNAIHLNLACNAYFVCGFAENAIGPKSYKPGDVFVSYSGKTVEIGNTDAEGRLVLGDANSYIAKNYKPDSIINIATLTGAVIIALGYEYTGLMASHDDLAEKLLQAAEITDDRAWRMPIYEELKEHVKSQIADIKNTGQPRTAGTISAGEFLRQFAQCESTEQKWAHLDIAGTAKPQNEVGYFSTLSTGAGVRLLTEFLANR
ncbi:MAG: leucyl aminopeptidase family protein [bacterium]|jgi:leucyl aminopeptidase